MLVTGGAQVDWARLTWRLQDSRPSETVSDLVAVVVLMWAVWVSDPGARAPL